jgi:curved DNA-binding protein CbpA
MKDYYQILGIHNYATQDEIKSAYRRLVVIYHPDKNPAPEADQRIKEINEAYHVLSDPTKRRKYDVGGVIEWDSLFTESPSPAHRDPAYRRRRAPPQAQNKPRLHDLVLKYRPYSVRISMISLFFCLIMLVDYCLPSKTSLEKIILSQTDSKYTEADGENSYVLQITTNYDNYYSITTLDRESFAVNSLVLVGKSRLFRIPRYVQSANGVRERIPATLFGNFLFLLLILTVTSAAGVFYRRSAEFQYSLGVVNLFVLILCLLFYFLKF